MRYVSLTMLISLSINLLGQDSKTRIIPLKDNGFEAKVEIYVANPKVKTDLELTYAWFKSREVHHTQGSYEGVLLHGRYVSFHDDNQLKEEGSYNTGLKDGLWKEWFANGTLRRTSNWRNGLLHGQINVYGESGVLLKTEKYKRGLLHGHTRIYKESQKDSLVKYKKGELVDKKIRPEKSNEAKSDTTEKGKFIPFKRKERKAAEDQEDKDSEKSDHTEGEVDDKSRKKKRKKKEKQTEVPDGAK